MNNITNKRSWVHLANKNREEEADLELKANLSRVLRQNFGLLTIFHEVYIAIHKRKRYWKRHLTEQEYRTNDWFLHHPDMITTNQPTPIIFEIDGPFHFMTGRGVKQTNDRNAHYDMAWLRLVWLTDKDAQNYDEVLVQILASRLARWGIYPKRK